MRACGRRKIIESVELSSTYCFSAIHKSYEKSMQKGMPKVIADAKRHRRPPWTLAIESEPIKGMKSADTGGIDEEQVVKHMSKEHKRVPK